MTMTFSFALLSWSGKLKVDRAGGEECCFSHSGFLAFCHFLENDAIGTCDTGDEGERIHLFPDRVVLIDVVAISVRKPPTQFCMSHVVELFQNSVEPLLVAGTILRPHVNWSVACSVGGFDATQD